MSFLLDVKDRIKEYAEIIASFVDCEVEIVDENMLRIAATGKFERLVGKVSKGAIYKDVLLNGESHVVENPSQHRLCKDCAFKERCQEKLEIAAPIIHNNEIIGVIGIVALKDIIKYKVLKDVSLYLNFTEQISDFISETISEYETNKDVERKDILQRVIRSFNKCAIIVNENNEIIDANKKATKELKLENYLDNNQNISIIPIDENIFGKKIFIIKNKELEIKVIGTLVSIFFITKKEYKIFFFNKYKI